MFQDTAASIVSYYLTGSALLLLLVVAIVTYAVLHQKKVIQFRTRLHEQEMKQQQAEFDALQEGEEKERTRVAEELHDGIGAKLSGLKMNLEYLKSNTTENQELIERVFSGITETLEEVRDISRNLLPAFFNERDLAQLLADDVERYQSGECQYDLIVNTGNVAIDQVTKKYCYRIVMELLTNIHKHAAASQASVQINIEDNMLEIAVEDNGIGFDIHGPEQKGIGLLNIRNRVNFCKGGISIDSSASGTTVIIEIPLNRSV